MSQTDVDETVRLRLTTQVERWRIECPAGHSGKALCRRTDHWYCRRCAGRDIHPAYDYVRDKRTGEFLDPSEVAFE